MTQEPRLLLDEMLSPSIAELLNKGGIDAVTVCGHEMLEGQPDERVLQAATDDDRCLVTENVRDFERIRSARAELGERVAGLLYMSAKRFPRTSGATQRISEAIADFAHDGRLPAAGTADWLA